MLFDIRLVVRSSSPNLGWIPVAILAVTFGCTPPPPEVRTLSTSTTSVNDEDLRQDLDEVLDFTLQRRRLNTVDHGAWQILHGVLAYQDVFPVQVGRTGDLRSAVEYATNGGEIRGWTFQPGDVLDPATGQRGLRAVVEPGTKKGQGHADQWLAILAQCHLPLDHPLKVDGETYTIRQLVEQVQHDAPYNAQQEWSWTLIGLTEYVPLDAVWTAADGETWSIERMVRQEIEQDIDDSACGGTHRLIGVATALRRHQSEARPTTEIWQRANGVVDNSIRRALELQNPDGSFSAQYFRRPSSSPDMAAVLGSSGHILEFLAVAMTDQQLQNPQLRLAARQLCRLFRDTQDLDLECGALYHAAHGLVLYRERLFGPRQYSAIPPAD